MRCLLVTLVYVDGCAPPMTYAVEAPTSGTVRDVLAALAKVAALRLPDGHGAEQHLLLGKLGTCSWAHPLEALGDPKARLADLGLDHRDPLIAYYYADAAAGPAAEGVRPHLVVHRRPKRPAGAGGAGSLTSSATGSSYSYGSGGTELFSAPLVLYLPQGCAAEQGQVRWRRGSEADPVQSCFRPLRRHLHCKMA